MKKSQDQMERNNINGPKSFKYLVIHVYDRLNWLEHINSKERKPSKCSRTSKESQATWKISQIHRRTLYKTVFERIWHTMVSLCLNPTYRMKRTCFDSKAIPTFHIESISHHPTEAYKDTWYSTPNM
ncbi:hypothetical protein AVEN_127792-1 [Araneus ventricosus]|uniref:Uncharacterized protein n=1 Tax=Araneus ventricosus TaxID=182803 RepID=A0A4Y2DRV2_ARAVE|nr:hypothetical protein AVEN_127792-1 [Araneus ventricosus]